MSDEHHEPAEEPLGLGLRWDDPESPLAPLYMRVSQVIAVVALALCFLFFQAVSLNHTDFWGHLKFGEWIVDHRSLPDREPFSPFSDKTSPQIHFQWLTQAGYALVFRAGSWLAGGDELQRLHGGAALIRLAHTLVILLHLVLMLLAFRRVSGSLALSCAGLLVYVVLNSNPLAVERPQLMGIFFFSCVLFALSRETVSWAALAGVPLVFLLWVNMHGSFVVGLAFLLLMVTGKGVEVIYRQGLRQSKVGLGDVQMRRFLVILVLSVIASCINPHGPAIFREVLQFARNPNVATLGEWQPLDFSFAPGGHRLYAAVLLLLLTSQIVSPRSLTAGQMLLVVTFGVFPLIQQRMLVWWAMLAVWMILPLWSALGEKLSWRWLHYRSTPSLGKTLFAGVVVLLALLVSYPVRWVRSGKPQPSLSQVLSPETPWQIAYQLQGHRFANSATREEQSLARTLNLYYPGGHFTGRIFASETLGDYLFWALPREMPVMVNTHVHLFSPEHWQECLAVKFAHPRWWEILDRRRVNMVLVEASVRSDLFQKLRDDPRWEVVVDKEIFLALRKKPL